MARGAGEPRICGSGAAVANAVYNATGFRVRAFMPRCAARIVGARWLQLAAFDEASALSAATTFSIASLASPNSIRVTGL